MEKKANASLRRVVTPTFQVSFPAIFNAKSFKDQEAKYSVVMLFDKNLDLSSLKKAATAAIVEKWGPTKDKWPKNLRLPFRDGDEKSDTPGYEGKIFVSASSKEQPGLVNQKLEPIINPKDFYAGCLARAELMAFAYDKMGNRGVSFGLQNLQKMGDGTPFSGRKEAKDAFDLVEDSSDDEESYSSTGDEELDLGFV